MRRLFATSLGCLLIALSYALVMPPQAGTDVLPVRFRLEQILTGTSRPTGLAIAPDGRIFYSERTTGQVRIIKGGILEPSPFIQVSVASSGAGEGLLDVVLHPSFDVNRRVYVFYTEVVTRANKIVRYEDSGGVGINPLAILTLPASADGTRIGGAMSFGSDGKLYVATGDLATSSNAQNSSSLAGKILRLNDDGTVPSDNPVAGSLVYAKGFRTGGGLGANTTVGTLYETDQGTSGVKEECNALTQGNATQKNYAWDIGSGKLNNPSYVDPLTEHATLVTPTAVVAYTKNRYPLDYQKDVYYGTQASGKVEEVDVTGAKLDVFASTKTFYNPTSDADGTSDSLCPKKWADSALSADGYIYLTVDAGSSANGIYRILYDDTSGPREVSPAGSTHPLLLRKLDATHIQLTFEDQKRDAFVGPPLATGQHNSKYTVWSGTLPIDANGDGAPDWSHSSLAATDATSLNDGTLFYDAMTNTITSEYYLVSSQNANLEGPPGYGTSGSPIPGFADPDWCDAIGPGIQNGKCPPEFRGENGLPLTLPDENGVLHSLFEHRNGNVVQLELAAFDCSNCRAQAVDEDDIEERYRARGFKTVVVMEKHLSGGVPYPDQAECTSGINSWRAMFGGNYTILCDKDTNGDGDGDVWRQFNRASCPLFPQNYYIDRNWTIYDYVCGTDPVPDSRISPKTWPEWCE